MVVHLIVRLGEQGIDEIVFPLTNVNDALDKIIELRETMIRNETNPNCLCVMTWDEKKFKCQCGHFGIKQMKEFGNVNHEKI